MDLSQALASPCALTKRLLILYEIHKHTIQVHIHEPGRATPDRLFQVAGLQKENHELGGKMAAATLETSEKARELAGLGKKLVAAEKAAEKLRQALKKLERERDARPPPEALVRVH